MWSVQKYLDEELPDEATEEQYIVITINKLSHILAGIREIGLDKKEGGEQG